MLHSQYRFLLVCILFVYTGCHSTSTPADQNEPRTIKGYKGLWYTLNQPLEYGDKYGGGLGTYTAKHHPLAVYAKEVNKTFFVYGGTTTRTEKHLLAMIAYYDHNSGTVPQPVVVHDKITVDDAHDNPSLSIDAAGHIWVFVSGRGSIRNGYIYRSIKPYNIDAFELILEDEFAYPQPWWNADQGFLFLFTRYTDGRELYWRTSDDGISWSSAKKLAIGGHYQMSNTKDGRIITAFNSHYPKRYVDGRTNLSFLSTSDRGQSWQTIEGKTIPIPVDSMNKEVLVRDYQKEGLLVYLKDIQFDSAGHPVLLYITSRSFEPGPAGSPRTWTIAHWKNDRWQFHEVAPASHNYDMGSLYIENDGWRIIAPTEEGPQKWGTGGEMAMWTSTDEGASWTKIKDLTTNSTRNHGYARRPLNAHPDFYAFWADGNTDSLSVSKLYFTNKDGDVFELPYDMEKRQAKPSNLTK